MTEQTPRLYPQHADTKDLLPGHNYIVVSGYDHSMMMLSCFTQVKEDGKRRSCVKLVPKSEKDDVVHIMRTAGYEVFDRTKKKAQK